MLRRRPLFKNVTRGNQSSARMLLQPSYSEQRVSLSIRWLRLRNRMRAQARIKAFQYIYMSECQPHATAAVTAGSILCFSDIVAQSINPSPEGYNPRRTLSMTVFGFLYYGFPCKYIYFVYDKFFGRRVVVKALVDCFLHGPLLLIPSYYAITNALNGLSLSESLAKLKKEWLSASLGTVAYWTPIQLICFKFVPMHSRVLWISSCSFFHKAWLSWFSN